LLHSNCNGVTVCYGIAERVRVPLIGPTERRSLPVEPDEQTSPEPVRMSLVIALGSHVVVEFEPISHTSFFSRLWSGEERMQPTFEASASGEATGDHHQ